MIQYMGHDLQVYQDGVRNLDLTFIFKNVAWPVITTLSLTIALPYITFLGIVPLTGMDCVGVIM